MKKIFCLSLLCSMSVSVFVQPSWLPEGRNPISALGGLVRASAGAVVNRVRPGSREPVTRQERAADLQAWRELVGESQQESQMMQDLLSPGMQAADQKAWEEFELNRKIKELAALWGEREENVRLVLEGRLTLELVQNLIDQAKNLMSMNLEADRERYKKEEREEEEAKINNRVLVQDDTGRWVKPEKRQR